MVLLSIMKINYRNNNFSYFFYLFSLLLFFTNIAFASTPNNVCFILYDLKQEKIITEINSQQCSERFSPCSTFKIPLSLMAFDQGIFTNENTIIKWDGIKRDFDVWNQDQTPKTYLQYSTAWVSKWLIPQIGSQKIQKYLTNFNYGNQDISGGITKFWLSSTLKISADEQLEFLKNLWQEKLNVSEKAMKLTKKSIYAETLSNSDILQGKTGSAELNAIGWFVGYLHHKNNDYIFVTNYIGNSAEKISAGAQAKTIAKDMLPT